MATTEMAALIAAGVMATATIEAKRSPIVRPPARNSGAKFG
jgi:hypothetical protein